MAKKYILIAVLILGCSFYTNQGESRATDTGNSHSDSARLNSSKTHRSGSPYRILNSRYVVRSSVQKLVTQSNDVRIRLMQNGMDNTDIEDFSLEYDSGTQYQMGHVYGIEHSLFPLYVKVTYRSWNTFHAVQNDVMYEFIIYSPGTWNVTICN